MLTIIESISYTYRVHFSFLRNQSSKILFHTKKSSIISFFGKNLSKYNHVKLQGAKKLTQLGFNFPCLMKWNDGRETVHIQCIVIFFCTYHILKERILPIIFSWLNVNQFVMTQGYSI